MNIKSMKKYIIVALLHTPFYGALLDAANEPKVHKEVYNRYGLAVENVEGELVPPRHRRWVDDAVERTNQIDLVTALPPDIVAMVRAYELPLWIQRVGTMCAARSPLF